MTDTCKYCGSQAVRWEGVDDTWRLYDTPTGKPHCCKEYELAKPRQPSVAKRKSNAARGAFLRWYGPRTGRTEALLVEPVPDIDTPAGMYMEPTKSTAAEVRKARGWK